MRCQPIVSLDSGDLAGVEALSRFPRTHHAPDAWLGDAERVGLGLRLQLAAVENALRLVDELPPGTFLTVNVGPDAIAASQLPILLEAVDPERIVLELTEHLAIVDYPRLRASLGVIRARGARLAIDDTGAGFASLGHIVNLRPELIKLDRQFTRGIDTDPVRRSLARALASFARDIGAEVISEAIETSAELETIRRLGIGYGQGYFIGRPAPAAALPAHYAHVLSRPVTRRQ